MKQLPAGFFFFFFSPFRLALQSIEIYDNQHTRRFERYILSRSTGVIRRFMDNTWGNLGYSTGTGTNNQHSNLSAIVSASIYSGTSSPGYTTSPWQRVTYCGGANGSAASQSHSMSQQQHNQIQRQPSQLRYFQVEKLAQYTAHNRHYARRYALVGSSPLLTLNSPKISDISTYHRCESVPYGNKCQSIDESAFRLSNFQSIDERIGITDRSSNQQNFSSLGHAYRSSNGTNPFTIEASFAAATFTPVDPVSSLPRLIPASVKSSLPRFVNAVVAVPDMMRDIRPRCRTIHARTTLTALPVSQEKFSYHAIEPRFLTRVESSITTKVESNRDKNWPELTLKTRRIGVDIFKTTGQREISSKSVWKKKKTRIRDNTEKLKTYADAVQKTTLALDYKYENQGTTVENANWIMNLRDNKRPSKMCPSFFHTSTPKIELRGVRKKREFRESCEDDNEHSSTSTASNGSYYGRSNTPETSSSPEIVNTTNWKETSSSSSTSSSPSLSSVRENDEDNNVERYANNENREKKVPSKKRLCKMAEMFCFGQLENAAFFRAFDEYNRHRRRMSYTQKLEDGPEVDSYTFHRGVETTEVIRGQVKLATALGVAFKREFFENESTRYQNNDCDNDFSIMSPYRIAKMEDQGAFKVLQKLKECADGNGAIYSNSWRPEELHFLRRCYQDKNI